MEHAANVVGAAIYRQAGLDPASPPANGAVGVACATFGGGILRELPRAVIDTDIATLWGTRQIVVRSDLSPPRANFGIARQVARLWLQSEPWYEGLLTSQQVELECRAGAWIVAPPAAVQRVAAGGVEAIAEAFCVTQTSAALRLGELPGGPGAVVTTPAIVYRRGALLAGFGDADIRELATHRAPRNVLRWEIKDEPGRVALFARIAA